MKLFQTTFLVIVSLATNFPTYSKEKATVNKKWFNFEQPTSLVISKSTLASRNPISTLPEIKDLKYITRLFKAISALPLDADEKMKSFSEDTITWSLKFCNKEGHCDQIDFYEGKIKTPNTGIYSETREAESKLSNEIQSLLEPKFNSAIPVISDFKFHFKDFEVLCLGEKESPPAPVTASFTTIDYVITPKKGETIKIHVVSGQMPPQPQPFKIGKTKLILESYELKNGFSLYPYYFAIQTKPRFSTEPVNLFKSLLKKDHK